MSRPNGDTFHQTRPIENGLFLIREIGRNNLVEETRLLALLTGLEETEHRLQALDELQEAEAYTDVEAAEVKLRMAKVRLREIQDRNVERTRIEAQQTAIHARFRDLWASEAHTFDQVEPEFATDATALGFDHVHPDLLVGISTEEMGTL
jgi:hypothetical protein